ncbi:MAG: MotA/TolQ/ExbB proton channel family protein [Pseudomonadota bacterium]
MIDVARERLTELLDLGGPVVAILLAMSVLALAIAIWKAGIFFVEGVGRGPDRGFVGRILGDLRVLPGGADAARADAGAKLDAGFGEAARGLRVLDLTAQLAPLLGLFGTVLGMIDAFRTLQEAGTTADPSLLAGGIWVALMTTAVGLCVAIPASVLLTWFDARLDAHRLTANAALEDKLRGASEAPEGHAIHA